MNKKNKATLPNTNRRRLFISTGDKHFHILSFEQRQDGSIYVSAPNLHASKWLELITGDSPELLIKTIPNAGKLSIHGSGVAHVRNEVSKETQLRLKGHFLSSQTAIGARHLFTYFPTEPTHLPASPAHNKYADCSIHAKELKPYVYIFLAVPASRRLNITPEMSLKVVDTVFTPTGPEGGMGAFTLRTHSVVWIAYRTNHMERWPLDSHFCFHNGIQIPVLIGTGEGEFSCELRNAEYLLDGDNLRIKL